MAEGSSSSTSSQSTPIQPSYPRSFWIPTSSSHIEESESKLLSSTEILCQKELVRIGTWSSSGWFGSVSDEPMLINTVTFGGGEGSPTLVLLHGYAASLGFFFRNFASLATRYRVIAIDQLGWGGSSRPDFSCNTTEETDAWFIDSFEEWRKKIELSNFILLGHCFGGYIAAKYALKHPNHVRHLILIGPAGFPSGSESDFELFTRFRATWKGAIVNHLWESNFTPQKIVRALGPWGPALVHRYNNTRFVSHASEYALTKDMSRLLSDYIYHTLAAKASGELCLRHIFSFGSFARSPLSECAANWSTSTTFIYGYEDWMSYRGAQYACDVIPPEVECEIIRVPKAGHYVFIDNPPAFQAAVDYACRRIFLRESSGNVPPPECIEIVNTRLDEDMVPGL